MGRFSEPDAASLAAFPVSASGIRLRIWSPAKGPIQKSHKKSLKSGKSVRVSRSPTKISDPLKYDKYRTISRSVLYPLLRPVYSSFHSFRSRHQLVLASVFFISSIKFPFHFQSLQSEWRIVFWITLGASIAQFLIFDIWGSAKVQPWNSPPSQSTGDVEIQLKNRTIVTDTVAAADDTTKIRRSEDDIR